MLQLLILGEARHELLRRDDPVGVFVHLQEQRLNFGVPESEVRQPRRELHWIEGLCVMMPVAV
jgi:hypothetical protein